MRRRILWVGGIVVALTSVLAVLLLLSPSDGFQFLEGKRFFWEPHTVPDEQGRRPPAEETNWAFEADWPTFMANADAELLANGWQRHAKKPPRAGAESASEAISYSRNKAVIAFYRDATPPVIMGSSSFLVANPAKGWIGISYYRPDTRPDWRRWLKDFLHLR